MIIQFSKLKNKIILGGIIALILGNFFASQSLAYYVLNTDPDGQNNPIIKNFLIEYNTKNKTIFKAEINTNGFQIKTKLSLYEKNGKTPVTILEKNIYSSSSNCFLRYEISNLKDNISYQANLLAENEKGYQALKIIHFKLENFSYSTDTSTTSDNSTQKDKTSNFSTPIQTERPETITNDFKKISSFEAELEGLVNPKNNSTLAWFEWGDNLSLNNKTEIKVFSGPNYKNVSIKISGLSPLSVYYYRLVAKNKNGLSFGETKSFVFPRTISYSYKKSNYQSSQKQIKKPPIKETSIQKINQEIKNTTTTQSKEKLTKNSQTASLANSLRGLISNKTFWIIFSLLFIFIVYLIFKK